MPTLTAASLDVWPAAPRPLLRLAAGSPLRFARPDLRVAAFCSAIAAILLLLNVADLTHLRADLELPRPWPGTAPTWPGRRPPFPEATPLRRWRPTAGVRVDAAVGSAQLGLAVAAGAVFPLLPAMSFLMGLAVVGASWGRWCPRRAWTANGQLCCWRIASLGEAGEGHPGTAAPMDPSAPVAAAPPPAVSPAPPPPPPYRRLLEEYRRTRPPATPTPPAVPLPKPNPWPWLPDPLEVSETEVAGQSVATKPDIDDSSDTGISDAAGLAQRILAEGFLRIQPAPTATGLQSRTLFLRSPAGLELTLVAMVHVGDPAYYRGLRDLLLRGYDRVLFELLVDEANIWVDARDCRRIADKLYPTDQAKLLARTHGLVTQLEALPMWGPNWVLADLSLQELREAQAAAGESPAPLPEALEALALVLWGKATGPLQRALRLGWWFAPCPEPTLLLLDWLWVGGRPAPVVGPLVDALAEFDILGARRLAFAQILVSGQLNTEAREGPAPTVLITQRNAVALRAVAHAEAQGCRRVALLYGAIHMPDLLARLLQDGYTVAGSRWETVWDVRQRRPPIVQTLPLPLRGAAGAVRVLALPLWFYLGGYDWAVTTEELGRLAGSVDPDALGEALSVLLLYFVRHGAVYYSLSKWVLEWNRELFSEYD